MELFANHPVVYKPVNEVDLRSDSSEFYLRPDVKAPRMAGLIVKIFVWFLESRIFGKSLLYVLKANNLIHKLITNAELEESPVFVPTHPFEDMEEQQVKHIDLDLSPSERVQEAVKCLEVQSEKIVTPDFRHWTIMDYSKAYCSGEITPIIVAERFIAALVESSNTQLNMSFFINYDTEDILKQATESSLRYKRGESISILDGVPIAIKDEIDCSPYPTTGGTKWLHKFRHCENDACCVKCLRSCGAILVGKTNMHELGAGTSGINPHYGVTRNPYNTKMISGGSSSGSAAVVAAGLCPAALGVDGGGSVRMPAALCGVVGFKPTFGRVPHDGVLPLNWTVGMVGILAGTIQDAFIVYAAIAGKLQLHQQTTTSIMQPKFNFPILNSTKPLSDIRLANYGEWFNDCSEEIRVCCYSAVEKLQKHYGWQTVKVTIPEIEVMRLAHYVTIASECSLSLSSYLQKLNFSELGWDARVALAVYGAFSSKEYIKAQRIRHRQMRFHENIFAQADVIVSPTTGVTAYQILDDAKETGELDYINGGEISNIIRERIKQYNREVKIVNIGTVLQVGDDIVRIYGLDEVVAGELVEFEEAALVKYSIAGNFLGLPAVTVPVGYDKLGLPIGLQFIGRPWSEATLIHIAQAMQALCRTDYRKPEVFFDLLHK